MSDIGRQSFTDKVGAAVKPDSQKSTTEHMGDKLKGNTDKASSTFQPQGQKSSSQEMGDTFSSGNKDESLTGKAKNALGMGDNDQ